MRDDGPATSVVVAWAGWLLVAMLVIVLGMTLVSRKSAWETAERAWVQQREDIDRRRVLERIEVPVPGVVVRVPRLLRPGRGYCQRLRDFGAGRIANRYGHDYLMDYY